MSLRSPLGTVLSLGSAKEGTQHWWGQRMSGIALVLLGLWMAWSSATMPGFAHADAVSFIGQPLNAVLLTLLSITMAYHSYLGIEVVVEDYVHAHVLRIFLLIVVRFAHVFLAVAAVFAILKLGIGT